MNPAGLKPFYKRLAYKSQTPFIYESGSILSKPDCCESTTAHTHNLSRAMQLHPLPRRRRSHNRLHRLKLSPRPSLPKAQTVAPALPPLQRNA